jgi:hypothetical protein
MSEIPFDTFQEFEDFVRSTKRRNKLHPIVERRLKDLLSRLFPDSHSVSEVAGVLGGRNDLMQFFFSGRRVLFELFFSASQVPQDLRLLEQSSADVKVAVLLDPNFKPKLADDYFRKKPDAFPYLWLSDLMLKQKETYCLARLQELIDENMAVNRLRRIIARFPIGSLDSSLNRHITDIERSLGITGSAFVPNLTGGKKQLTGSEFLALIVIGQIKKLDIPLSRLRSLYAWLKDTSVITSMLRLVELGFQTYVVADSEGQHAIWTAFDLADYMFVVSEKRRVADIIFCVNDLINEFMMKNGFERKPIRWHLFYAYEEDPSVVRCFWEEPEERISTKK